MRMQTKVAKVMPNLPCQIIELNILTRVPIKTLIRFTTVCKSWYSLLFDPYFINIYKQILKNRTTNVLLIDYNEENRIVAIDSCSPEQSLYSLSYTSIDDYPLTFVDVVGCCEGLVCFLERSYKGKLMMRKINLWNPALKIKKIVDIHEQYGFCFGFGYDKQTEDYKVIKYCPYYFRGVGPVVVDVYSLTTNAWKKIEPNRNQIPTGNYTAEEFAVYASFRTGGAYCCLARKRDLYDRDTIEVVIISFNMKAEAFKKITLPYNSIDIGCRDTLFIYKDSLALLHTRNSDPSNGLSSRTCHVWVMKDYDDPMSWTKLIDFDSSSCYVSFVGVIETELLLMRCGYRDDEEVIVFDIGKSQEKKAASFVKDVRFSKEAMWVGSFTESLALGKGSSLFKKLSL